jgi:hypothetical protein
VVSAIVTAGAGFLLAVLWFDLMFDAQVLRHRGDPLPANVLESIAAYYRRVTIAARPMSWLVAAVMLATLVAIVVQIVEGDAPRGAAWASLLLAGAPIGIAMTHTFPAAVRLGARAGTAEEQSRLARSICRDHVLCLGGIISLLAVQLVFVA